MKSAFDIISKNTKLQKPNLSIFTNIQEKVSSDQCADYKKCYSSQRLFCSLKYYALLNYQDKSIENKSIFSQFIMDIYNNQMIDDFYHLTHKHAQQLQQIMEHNDILDSIHYYIFRLFQSVDH